MSENTRSPVTVLGTGAIGTAVATALLRAGHAVTVWNRTPASTRTARSAGAEVADDAAAAVAGSTLALVCVTDHGAARDLLERLPLAEGSGRTVAVLTTGTPDDAVVTGSLAAGRGMAYLDVGVQTAPEDIGTPRATLLLAGPERSVEDHRAALEALGPVRWVGPDPRAAAVRDLALFGLWYDAQLGLLRALDLVEASGSSPADLAEAAAQQLSHVVSGAAATAAEVTRRDHPRGPASLGEHLPVLRQLVAERDGARLGDGGLGAVAELVAAYVASGHGDLGLSAVLDRDLPT